MPVCSHLPVPAWKHGCDAGSRSGRHGVINSCLSDNDVQHGDHWSIIQRVLGVGRWRPLVAIHSQFRQLNTRSTRHHLVTTGTHVRLRRLSYWVLQMQTCVNIDTSTMIKLFLRNNRSLSHSVVVPTDIGSDKPFKSKWQWSYLVGEKSVTTKAGVSLKYQFYFTEEWEFGSYPNSTY